MLIDIKIKIDVTSMTIKNEKYYFGIKIKISDEINR